MRQRNVKRTVPTDPSTNLRVRSGDLSSRQDGTGGPSPPRPRPSHLVSGDGDISGDGDRGVREAFLEGLDARVLLADRGAVRLERRLELLHRVTEVPGVVGCVKTQQKVRTNDEKKKKAKKTRRCGARGRD